MISVKFIPRFSKFGVGGGGGGGVGVNKVHYGLCENGELARWSAGTDLREFLVVGLQQT